MGRHQEILDRDFPDGAPSGAVPVRKFIEEGGFAKDWYKSLSKELQWYQQLMYWNHVNSCFSAAPFPGARLQFFGDDSDVVWDVLDIADVVIVWFHIKEQLLDTVAVLPRGFKSLEGLMTDVIQRQGITHQ
jgi:hypothetical protein